MTRKRGDDDAQGPGEVPVHDEGFPVSAASAPETHSDDAAAGTVDGAAAEGDDPVATGDAAAEGVKKIDFTFHREFRKHVQTGDIVAVELVNGALTGVRLCTKPEEQTAGALPVMQLEDIDGTLGQWYRGAALDFKTWEPPPPPKALMDRLRALYEQAVTVRATYASAKLAAKHAKERVEEVDEAIFHALRRMHDALEGQPELPLEPDDLEPEDQYREATIKDGTGIDV